MQPGENACTDICVFRLMILTLLVFISEHTLWCFSSIAPRPSCTFIASHPTITRPCYSSTNHGWHLILAAVGLALYLIGIICYPFYLSGDLFSDLKAVFHCEIMILWDVISDIEPFNTFIAMICLCELWYVHYPFDMRMLCNVQFKINKGL